MTLEQATPRSRRFARAGWHLAGLLAALVMAACGSGGGDPPPGVPGVDYQVFGGSRACGADGCGGDSGDGSGVGSGGDGGDGAGGGLGEMRNVKVTVTKPDGTVLGSANLVDNLVSLYPGNYKGAILLEFADDGSGSGAYFDEGLTTWVLLGSRKLHVMIPALTHHVSVNLLTEAAYQLALHNCDCSRPDVATMTAANEAVRVAFNERVPAGYKITDITNYSVAVSDKTTAGTLPNTHAGRLGTLFAAIPKAALRRTPGLPAPVLAFADQLLGDVLDDGVINNSNAVASGSEAYGPDLPQALSDAVGEARGLWGSSAQPAPNPAPTTCFNTALFTVGTRWSLSYLDTDILGETGPTAFDETAEVTAIKPFLDPDGKTVAASALEVTETFTDGSSVSNYFDPDLSAGIKSYGSLSIAVGAGSTRTVYTPPYTNRMFLLAPGETDSIDIIAASTFIDARGTRFDLPVTTATQSTTFVGYGDVTVPAGTFKNACHYTQPNSSQGLTHLWLTSSGQGILVLEEEFDAAGSLTFKSELTSGTVNGTPAR